MTIGTTAKVSAVVLVAAACVYFVVRTPGAESRSTAVVDLLAADAQPADVAYEAPARSAEPQRLVAEVPPVSVLEEPPAGVSVIAGTHVLRVVLEGITEEDAREATVTLTGVDGRRKWPAEIRDSWTCQGLTNVFDLDPFLARVDRHGNLRVDELEVEVDHPVHLLARTRAPLSRDVEPVQGKIVHEVVVHLIRPEYWPAFTLAVRDAFTREHLDDIELLLPTSNTAYWGTNEPTKVFARGLASPLALMGGREPDAPQVMVAGLALSPTVGNPPRLVELPHHFQPERGVRVAARAPGYAWGSIAFDVSAGEEQELLLVPSSTLHVRLANAQVERYASLGAVATLCVYMIRDDGGNQYVRFEPLDEKLTTEELRLDSLVPRGYRVTVELDGGSWAQRPVLALEEVHLAAGETREVVVTLDDPPPPPERASLGGTVSFPVFGGESVVRLEFYETDRHDVFGEQARYQLRADVELPLAELERVGGALPTWSFHVADLPVGHYQVELWPFLKSWMIELPAGGREDVQLVIPEFAEVLVETVDASTGERIPIDEMFYRHEEDLPRRVQIDRNTADLQEPGRFRFWTAPGAALIYAYHIPSELNYGRRYLDLELVPGRQSVRYELEPVYTFRVDFRDGGATLDRFDELWGDAYAPIRDNLRPVGHEGRVTSIHGVGVNREVMLLEVSAPGVYEIGFEDIGADRFLPIPSQLVDVRAGEATKVIVELQRK